MTKAVDLIQLSLQTITVDTVIQPADPSMFKMGLLYLIDLLSWLEKNEINLTDYDSNGDVVITITIPTNDQSGLSTDITEPPSTTVALIDALAVRMAMIAQVPVTALMLSSQKQAILTLQQMYRDPTMPVIVPSALLTFGQGGTRGVWPQTFFDGLPLATDTSARETE